MPKVTVWKCPRTGKLFESREKYQAHLLRQRARRNKERRVAGADQWLQDLRKTTRTFEELAKELVANQDMAWAVNKTSSGRTGKHGNVIGLTIRRPTWSSRVSNTHACPIGGTMNWYNHHHLPSGYPGWLCQISVCVDGGSNRMSSFIDIPGITCGTGSGNGDTFAGSAYIFAHDWPGLFETEMRKQALQQLNDAQNEVARLMGLSGKPVPITELPTDWVPPQLPPLE